MSDSTKALPGSIAWIDLTVSDADGVRKFYEAVAGWKTSLTPMGDYSDNTTSAAGGTPVSGICHKFGVNAVTCSSRPRVPAMAFAMP